MTLDWIISFATNIFSSAAWDGVKKLFREHSSPPIMTLGLELPPDAPPGPLRQAADLATLGRIQALLPSTEITMQYVRDHSFGNAHRGAFLEPLDRFLEQTEGPEHQFLSRGLERRRQELRKAVSSFQLLRNKYTFPHRIQPDMYEVPGAWELNGSGLYWKAVNELNAAATAIVHTYADLVQIARKELLQ